MPQTTVVKGKAQPEALLQRIKRQTTELGCNEVRAVLHDLLETNVLLRALPAWNKVEHVLAVGGLAIVLASLACQLHAERLEDGLLPTLACVRDRVTNSSQSMHARDYACMRAIPFETPIAGMVGSPFVCTYKQKRPASTNPSS